MKNKIFILLMLLVLPGAAVSIVSAQDNYADDSSHGHDHGNNDDLRLDATHEMQQAKTGHDEHGTHDEHGSHDAHGEDGANLNSAQLEMAGIVVEALLEQVVAKSVNAPGEVMFNAYKSKKITPRIVAQVLKRHAQLGDHVKAGQALVSLSSVEMARAQGDLIVSDREWRRVKKLGKKVVSDRRYVEAQIARQQAHAKVQAYGMTSTQIAGFLKANDPEKAIGKFELVATQDGTITRDDFVDGEMVEPGKILFEITDETSMWVEARLTPNAAAGIKPGITASIIAGKQTYPARVIQIHHQLDEATRTIAIRLEVENHEDILHPGQFVQTQIQAGEKYTALALPKEAVLRSPDGDWVVFVENASGAFSSQEITLLGQSGDIVMIDGIETGRRVVTKGAFFVQSEIAKSGFEVHNH